MKQLNGKVIITCAITGSIHTPTMSPHLPVTPEQIAEQAVGAGMPISIYPLFENALRAARGQSLDEHRRAMGELFAPFTSVAAKNPHAWFPTERSASELVEVTPQSIRVRKKLLKESDRKRAKQA